MTTTRYYLTPTLPPTWNNASPQWSDEDDLKRATLTAARPTSGTMDNYTLDASSTNSEASPTCIGAHAVGPATLPAGPIRGTLRAVYKVATSFGTSSPTYLRVVVKVISGDGATLRGVLFTGEAATMAPSGSAAATRTVAGTLTEVTAQAGDRLVVEVGARITHGGFATTATLYGAGASSPDYAYADGQTSGMPWVELETEDPPPPPTPPPGHEDATWRLEATVAGLDPLVAWGPATGELEAEDLPRVVRASWVDELDPDDQSWPARQDVSTGQLQLLMATAAEAAAITATSPVAVELFRPADATTPVATFYGRAGEPQLAIHDHGVMVSLAITDYLADLAEPTIGDVAYPAEMAGERALRILGEAGHGQPDAMPGLAPGPAGVWPPVAARDASATAALPLLQRALHVCFMRRYVITDRPDYFLPELWTIRPNVDPATGLLAANPWRGEELPTEAETTPVLQLVEVAGVWQLAAPAAGEPATAGVIPGAAIPHSASWVRPKGRNPNTIDVVKAGERVVSTVLAGTTTPVVHRIETDLTADADAAQLGAFLLPLGGADPASSWEAEGFTVLVDQTPPGWWPGQLRDVRTVTGLQPRHNPEGRDWWAGTIAAIEVDVSDGQLTAKLQLEARAVVPGPDAITWAELDPAMSWTELAPTITWAELAHVRA